MVWKGKKIKNKKGMKISEISTPTKQPSSSIVLYQGTNYQKNGKQ